MSCSEIEGDITMIPESITITGNRVTFRATFDHFSVFAIIARPSAATPHKGGGGGTYPPVLTVTPTITPTPTPVEPTVVAVGTLTPTVAAGARRMVLSHKENPARHCCWHLHNLYIMEITK